MGAKKKHSFIWWLLIGWWWKIICALAKTESFSDRGKMD